MACSCQKGKELSQASPRVIFFLPDISPFSDEGDWFDVPGCGGDVLRAVCSSEDLSTFAGGNNKKKDSWKDGGKEEFSAVIEFFTVPRPPKALKIAIPPDVVDLL